MTKNQLLKIIAVLYVALCCNCECITGSGSLSGTQEIFRSTVSGTDCCTICKQLDVCNAWTKCDSQQGCQLKGIPLAQGECAFEYSETVAKGMDPLVNAVTQEESGDLKYGYYKISGMMKKKGPIAFTTVNEQKSAKEYLQESNEAQIFVDLSTSDNLEPQLKSDIANPDFNAVLCIPTDDAFKQFFDNNGFSQKDLESDGEAVTKLMKQNIIPGNAPLPKKVGENTTVPSLLEDSGMVIERLPNMGISVITDAMETAAVKTVHVDIGDENLQTWTLDQVLLPPQFTVLITVYDTNIHDFIKGQPGLNILSQILDSYNFSILITHFIDRQFPQGRFYAPIDKIFNQYFELQGTNLEEFLQDKESVEFLIGSLMTYSEDADVKSILRGDIWNGGQDVEPTISLKAQLGDSGSVWVVNNLYPDLV